MHVLFPIRSIGGSGCLMCRSDCGDIMRNVPLVSKIIGSGCLISGDIRFNGAVVSEIIESGGRTGGDIMWNGKVVSETIKSGCPIGCSGCPIKFSCLGGVGFSDKSWYIRWSGGSSIYPTSIQQFCSIFPNSSTFGVLSGFQSSISC